MGLNSYRKNAILGIAFAAMLAASSALPSLMTANVAYAAPANLTVNATSTSGAVLNIHTVIQSGGSLVNAGLTPLSITGNTGTTYTVTPSDYNDLTFARWEDGSTIRARTVLLSSPTSVTAIFNSCAPQTVTGWIANGDDGNVPANTLDNSLSTRWANLGKGSWIRYDLGQSKTVCDLDISWFRGNERQNDFVVSISQDDKVYTNVYTGKSSGTTLSQEDYNIPDTAARYVKVTVNGNTMNDWASITEVDISGTSSSPIQQPPPTEPAPTSSTADKFGVKMLYPTKSTGETWAMNMDSATSDSRFDPKNSITKNSDGSWKMTSSQVRMNVFTSSGYHPEKISSFNQVTMATKGYMQDAKDWRNVEITGFVKVISASSDNFSWYGRSGKHTDSNGGCEGTAYKGRLFYDGKTGFAKEQQHADGYAFSSLAQATGSIFGKWVGFKTVMYNNAQGNVVLQNWINENGDRVTWKKVNEKIDSTGWGSDGDMCGGSPDQKISWGGPIVTFRWDSASNVDFKWLSVREIQPPT